jgi:hypothetical protein
MKIRNVRCNNRKKLFEVTAGGRTLHYPFSRLRLRPSSGNAIREVSIDPATEGQSFSYALASGHSGTVHLDHVLDYDQPPVDLRARLLDALTAEARRRVGCSGLSRREIVRRLGTSASQLYRLVDPANRRKSIDQVVRLLEVLDCDVDVSVKNREEPTVRHSSDGVDVSLVRWTLSLTPAERLRVLQDHVNSVLRLRDGPARR